MEEVGIGLIVLLVIFNWMAWKSNIESTRSWLGMQHKFTPNDYGSIGWKRDLIEQATYPIFSYQLKTFENGYYHNIRRGTAMGRLSGRDQYNPRDSMIFKVGQ